MRSACPLLSLVCLAAVHDAAAGATALRAAQLEPEEGNITFKVYPGMPTSADIRAHASASSVVAQFAATEAHAAAAQAASAASVEDAARSQLASSQAAFASEQATRKAMQLARAAYAEQREAEAAAIHAREIVGEIPAAVKRAAERGAKEAVDAVVSKLNTEAREVADAAEASQAKLAAKAVEAGREGALPFQQAKLRSAQAAVGYVARAQELAHAVGPLKTTAIKLAKQANDFQANGNVVEANQIHMRAEDLMDKAQQMEDRAKSFDKTANDINAGLGAYDLAANAASAYSEYQAHPRGASAPLPPLPAPLVLPPGAPAGAPAPAAAGAPA